MRYGYVGGDPVNRVDPTGLSFLTYAKQSAVGVLIVGAVLFAVGYLYYFDDMQDAAEELIDEAAEGLVGVAALPAVFREFFENQPSGDNNPETDPDPRPGPVDPPLPPWIDDDDDKGFDISLGLSKSGYEPIEVPGSSIKHVRPIPILKRFTANLNADPSIQNPVFYWREWPSEDIIPEGLNQTNQFLVAALKAEHVHFNLEGIDDPLSYMYDGYAGYIPQTARELQIIYEDKELLCHKITFYQNGSTSPQIDTLAWAQICGVSSTIP